MLLNHVFCIYLAMIHTSVRNVNKSKNRKRNRRIICFNPPFSSILKTNIEKRFLQMIKDCFPPSNPLHKICKRNTLKLSYRTMPNMKAAIAGHNSKIPYHIGMAGCTSVCDDQCPLPGNCTVKNVVYRATDNRSDNNTTERYTRSTYWTYKEFGAHEWHEKSMRKVQHWVDIRWHKTTDT